MVSIKAVGTMVPVKVTEDGVLELSVVDTGSTELESGATGVDLTLTGDLTVDTNTFFVDTTNNKVGILTASPGDALTVVGNVNVTQNLTVNNSLLVVDGTSGRVGIGTAAPTKSLHVIGDVNISGKVRCWNFEYFRSHI